MSYQLGIWRTGVESMQKEKHANMVTPPTAEQQEQRKKAEERSIPRNAMNVGREHDEAKNNE